METNLKKLAFYALFAGGTIALLLCECWLLIIAAMSGGSHGLIYALCLQAWVVLAFKARDTWNGPAL